MTPLLNGKIVKEAVTFDDVLLIPQYSNMLPSEVSISTQLTEKIKLNIPIISAAMDTVTGHKLAIAMAKQGGIGILHKNFSIEEQATEVDKVKRYQSGMITNPVTLNKESILEDAIHIMKQYRISGLPVIESDGTLIGIITNRDLKYQKNLKGLVSEFMTKENLITSQRDVTLDQAKEILLKNRIEKLPIVDQSYKLCGLITIKDIDNLDMYPHACKDDKGRLCVGAAVGAGKKSLKRVQALVDSGVDLIAVDSAHGHSEGIINAIEKIRSEFPNLDLIGGNIVTAKASKALIDAGVNALKVGIGPGSICTTRVIAGVGVPQITAINDVYQYAKTKGVSVISDGGIKHSGDIVKAIAAGASCVMLGGLLAGTEEAPGDEMIFNGRKFKTYVGMGSLIAMKRGSKDRYFQTSEHTNKLVPEGIEGRVPYKGELKDIIYQLCGGLRAGMGYCGASTVKQLMESGKFVKITGAGVKESHPHDVSITKEAPNYHRGL